MLEYLNSLYSEQGYIQIILNILTDLTEKGIYEYDGSGREEYDPYFYVNNDPRNIKKSRIQIYANNNETFKMNMDDELVLAYYSSYIVSGIRNEENEFRKVYNDNKIDGNKAKNILELALEEISFYKKQFKKCTWLNDKSYILDEIAKLEKSLNNRYAFPNKLVKSMEQQRTKPLIWHGSSAKLFNLFAFLSKDFAKKEGVKYYIDATREEIEDFIYYNFVDENGGNYDRSYITKVFNPNNTDRQSNAVKKLVKTTPDS